jgi:hypothetical protein
MKLADQTVTSLVRSMSRLLSGSTLELWDGLTLLASLPVGDGQVVDGELLFGKMGPVSAAATGSPTTFRLIDVDGGLILEGDSSEQVWEPSSHIEQGAEVSVTALSYRQPASNEELA